MRTFNLVAGGVAAALIAGVSVVALAQDDPADDTNVNAIVYTAELTGAEQVPPVETAATGTATVTFDATTLTVSWDIIYDDLSGPAVAAHIHGPAALGENAPPVIDFGTELESQIEGSAVITEEQAADLANGLYYVNIHTAQFPDGEIRGQLMLAEDDAANSDEDADMDEPVEPAPAN
jgi:hypothetical protein